MPLFHVFSFSESQIYISWKIISALLCSFLSFSTAPPSSPWTASLAPLVAILHFCASPPLSSLETAISSAGRTLKWACDGSRWSAGPSSFSRWTACVREAGEGVPAFWVWMFLFIRICPSWESGLWCNWWDLYFPESQSHYLRNGSVALLDLVLHIFKAKRKQRFGQLSGSLLDFIFLAEVIHVFRKSVIYLVL